MSSTNELPFISTLQLLENSNLTAALTAATAQAVYEDDV
jgi:hypothetical protein